MTTPSTDTPDTLTPGETAEAWNTWRTSRCTHCGGVHARACPRVRRLEWHPNSQLAAVEFWPDGKWSDQHVIWPENLPDPPEGT